MLLGKRRNRKQDADLPTADEVAVAVRRFLRAGGVIEKVETVPLLKEDSAPMSAQPTSEYRLGNRRFTGSGKN